MCCIFTCCGWVVDLIQRFWAFSMSCCISSAVCCALFTAAMAGIALGYNYSLAEYIDIKETNVSVYLKRGVFDDEIANEMEWRRSGNALPPPETKYRGGNFDITVPTSPSSDQLDFRRNMDNPQDGRRRLDDSILASDDANKYEGSLMRLTAGVPASLSTITEEISSADPRILEIADQYPRESIDQLKALQGMVNLRKGNLIPKTTPIRPPEPTFNPDHFKNIPPGILNFLPDTMRRAMQYSDLGLIPNYNSANVNPARKAVPMPMDDRDWRDPKVKDKNYFTNDLAMGVDIHPTYPGPVNLNLRPARPTRPRAPAKYRDESVKGGEKQREREDVLEKSIDSELGKFKEKLMLDKFDMPRMPEEGMGDRTIKKGDDYDEEIRGLPVRRRRGELPRSRIRRDLKIKINHNDSIVIANDNYPSTPKIHSVFKTDMKNNSLIKTNNTENIKTDQDPNIAALLTNLNLLKKDDEPDGVVTPQNKQNNRLIIIADNTSYLINVSSPQTNSKNNEIIIKIILNTNENDKDATTQNTYRYPSFLTISPSINTSYLLNVSSPQTNSENNEIVNFILNTSEKYQDVTTQNTDSDPSFPTISPSIDTSYLLNVSSPQTNSENNENFSFIINTSEKEKDATTQNTNSYLSFPTVSPGIKTSCLLNVSSLQNNSENNENFSFIINTSEKEKDATTQNTNSYLSFPTVNPGINTSCLLNVSSSQTNSENNENFSFILNTSEKDKDVMTQNTDSYPSFPTIRRRINLNEEDGDHYDEEEDDNEERDDELELDDDL